MLPASNRGAGQNIGFPDVCLTPAVPAPIPVPYPNIAMNAQAMGFSQVVKISMVPALNMGSKIPMTTGDEGGAASPIKGAGQYTMGNPIVAIDRLPAINLLCPTTGNNMNNPLGAALVPSAVNVMYCLRPESSSAAAAPNQEADITELAERMTETSLQTAELMPASVGYFRLRQLGPDASTALFAAARRLEAKGMRAMLLDLRGNPGGALESALQLADDFLPAGAVLARTEDHDGETHVHRAKRPAHYRLPLVVLIDGGTASAAELLAACLQDHARAMLIGARSYGKFTVQRIAADHEDRPLRATCATWQRPSSHERAGRGLLR